MVKSFEKLKKRMAKVSGDIFKKTKGKFLELKKSILSSLSEMGQGGDFAEQFTFKIHYAFLNLSHSITGILRGISAAMTRVFGHNALVDGFTKSMQTASTVVANESVLVNAVGQTVAKVGLMTIPVQLVMHRERVFNALKDIGKAIREGEILNAVKILAGGIDTYIGGAIRTLGTVVNAVIGAAIGDASGILDLFPKIAEEAKTAFENLKDTLMGVFGGLTGLLEGPFEVLMNAAGLFLDIFTGIDSDSIVGKLVTAFIAIKVGIWGCDEGS